MGNSSHQARRVAPAQTISQALDETIRQLRADNALKAWSVIITFFGDAVVPRGGKVSAATVQALMQRFGTEAGAVRTAFSRLVRDGWVVREKRGRQSFYTLSAQGAEPFQRATRRIYSRRGPDDSRHGEWLLLFNPQADAGWAQAIQVEAHGVRLAANCVLVDQPDLVSEELLHHDDYLLLRGRAEKVPQWLSALAGPDDLAQGLATLQARFSPLQHMLETDSIDPLDAMAMRCLLIHEWRRLLLKSADLSSALLPDDWPREPCRAFVARLYQALLCASETWLDEQGLATTASDAQAVLQRRFS